VVVGATTTVVDSVAPQIPTDVVSTAQARLVLPAGPSERVPLGRVVGARSGDKGGHANVGLFARGPVAWSWLATLLTTERLRELLPEAATLEIERYEFDNLWSLNFLLRGLLGEGVAASTRQDGQAKSLGEWLRARHVEVPLAVLEEERTWSTSLR
jgi:hypothetical protein